MREEAVEEPTSESLVGWLQVFGGTMILAVLPLAVLGTAFIASANPDLPLLFSAILFVLVAVAVGLPLTLLVLGVFASMGAFRRWRDAKEARRWQDEVGDVVLRPDAWEEP